MADQTIALQARAPQGNSMAAAIRQNSQLMNMMTQQAAAQRQSAVAEQQMQLAQAKEARDVSAADIKLAGDKIDYYTKRAGQTMNPEGYAVLLQDLDKDAPDVAAAFRANLPPERFSRDDLLKMVGSISDNFSRTYAPLETKVVQNDDGTFAVARIGGFEKPGVFELPQFNLRQGGAARPAPSGNPAPQAPSGNPAPQAMGSNNMARPSRGANTTPQDLLRQGVNPKSIPSGNPLQPMSMTTGGDQAAQQDLGAIVQTMMQTGVISQAGVDAMRAAAPGKEDQLAQIMRENNIQIMPNEGGAPGMSNAVFRPGVDAMPQRQNVQSMDDYYATGQAARGRDLNQGAIPGSSRVPIPRVRAEAEAGRESPAEAAAKARAVAAVTADADTAKQERQRDPARRQVSTLINKVRGAYEALEKAQAIPSEKRGGFANAMDYMATSSLGREAQKMVATNESKYLSEITNSRKLLATAIKNATGMTAQEMNSNVELTLMLDALTDPTQGIEAARSTLDTLEELFGPRTAPSSGAGVPATSGIPQGAIDKLRKNPSLRGAFDAKYGAGAAARAFGGR